MRFIIYGTGAIGGTIAARLYDASIPAVCIARGKQLSTLRKTGLTLHVPDRVILAKPEFVEHPREIHFGKEDIVLLCMKSQHTQAAIQDLYSVAGADIPVVCVQNGVANERIACKLFSRVYACVVVVPALYQQPGIVACHAGGRSGILDIGRYCPISKSNTPAVDENTDSNLGIVTTALRRAGFGSRATPAIMDWKYAKLTSNLGNIIQAAVQPSPTDEKLHKQAWQDCVRALTRQLNAEARACYEAAGITYLSQKDINARCEEEAVDMRAKIKGIDRIGGSTLQSILRGTGNIETDYLNGEIVKLGERYDIQTPANAVMQNIGREIIENKLGIGHFSITEVLQRIENAHS